MARTALAKKAIALSLVDGAELPSEFRLFESGWNDTEKGRFLFDAVAAAAVMEARGQWGVDLMIDLEHQALEAGTTADPTARDARGWARLELRSDGSLWAVDVKWTPDGAARLEQRRQRYVSPAFEFDPESLRVSKIVNVAITALPATHHTPALVAASLMGAGMDPKTVQAALDALIAGDSEKCAEILKNAIAAAASDPDAATEDAPPPAGDGGADETTEMSDAGDVSTTPPPGDDESGPAKKKPAPPAPPAKAAASARLVKLTGKSTEAEAFAEVEAWRASHLELEAGRQRNAEEAAKLEAAERRRLCVDLVKLGAEFPATIWADPTAKTPSKLKARWASMPIAELRSHVADQRAARGVRQPTAAPAPAGEPSDEAGGQTFATKHGPVTLSARELANCKQYKADPATYAENKAFREAAKLRRA